MNKRQKQWKSMVETTTGSEVLRQARLPGKRPTDQLLACTCRPSAFLHNTLYTTPLPNPTSKHRIQCSTYTIHRGNTSDKMNYHKWLPTQQYPINPIIGTSEITRKHPRSPSSTTAHIKNSLVQIQQPYCQSCSKTDNLNSYFRQPLSSSTPSAYLPALCDAHHERITISSRDIHFDSSNGYLNRLFKPANIKGTISNFEKTILKSINKAIIKE